MSANTLRFGKSLNPADRQHGPVTAVTLGPASGPEVRAMAAAGISAVAIAPPKAALPKGAADPDKVAAIPTARKLAL